MNTYNIKTTSIGIYCNNYIIYYNVQYIDIFLGLIVFHCHRYIDICDQIARRGLTGTWFQNIFFITILIATSIDH